MPDIYLLLGSNLGNQREVLEKATGAIEKRIGKLIKLSSLYITEAWGNTDQPAFINQVVHLESALSARAVLETVLDIEKQLGRERHEKWGARVIDIDILFYGHEVIHEPDLIIPHPYFQERRFAVEPMLEISSEFEHPALKKKIKVIALELTDKLSVQRI